MINFKNIENKWQKKWEEKKIFEVKKNKKSKYYCLEMFPYPSGAGLHIGHSLNYTIADIRSRFKIMQGFNVLHPILHSSVPVSSSNQSVKSVDTVSVIATNTPLI